MGRSWKLRVGAPLGKAQASMPMGAALRKVAESITHERVVKPKKGRGSGYKKGGDANIVKRRWTAEQVLSMRRRYKGGERICDLAREFGVHAQNMLMILNGSNYAWVPMP